MDIVRALLSFIFLVGAQPTFAHSPYFGQSEQLQINAGSSLAIKLLYGDGIFAGDPVRAVVIDSDLRVRAISPLALTLHIICHQEENERLCVVYDSSTSIVYALDPENWSIGPVLEDQGRPLREAYPEEMGKDFGFKGRPATYLEIIRFEGDKIQEYPLLAGLALIWWSLIALLLAPLFWRLCRNRGRIRFGSTIASAFVLLRLAGAVALLFVTFFWWEIQQFSLYFAGFFAMFGATTGLILTRPRPMANYEKKPV